MRARLNGWQRLWIIISILYLLPWASNTILHWPTAGTTWHGGEFVMMSEGAAAFERRQLAWNMTLGWLIPCLVLYALGWAIAWVRRGFRSEDPRGPEGK